MVVYYGLKGLISSLVLLIYAVLTIAIYKVLGVTLSLPGIAGLILSVGMAVDSNILVFERMKEELRLGQSFSEAIEQGFGRAWDSIKDANLATIMTALVLINPLDFSFLNTSGLVRGFGLTLLIGVVLGLFTGVFVSRSLLKVFLPILNWGYVIREKKKGQK
jgi:preprotein translocase subunit SecD